ncbi:hypothetical protein [Prescottella agglutinans]|uniref:hypothetical protein n=1 Tax=Prescottella agglutinans TaxID=1644129 RepID=UPI003D997650
MSNRPGSRLFDAILFCVSLAVTLVLFLFVPLDGTQGLIDATVAFFGAMASVAGAALVAVRYEYANRDRRPRWLFIWILPVATVLVMVPWLLSPAFSLPEIGGALGAVPLFTMLAYGAALAGLIITMLVLVPVELFIRGVVKLVTTRGKGGYGRLIVGLYGFVLIGFISLGVKAASSDIRVNVDGQLLAALLGLPGDYTVKDDHALVAARVLGVVLVLSPILYQLVRRKFSSNIVIEEIEALVP